MSNFDQEKFYYVDPGIGEKGRGCPYTYYKDGRDVKSFITPPSGYELTDFKLEPYPEDKFYDGKIVAQYRKIPFSSKLSSNLLNRILALLIIVLLSFLAYYIFNNYRRPKPASQPLMKPNTEIKVIAEDTLAQEQVPDTPAISKVVIIKEPVSKNTSIDEVVETHEVQKEASLIEKIEEVQDEENKISSNPKTETEAAQGPQLSETLTKDQFQQEFWNLIHRQERHMRTYGDLYRKYKSLHLKSKEFNYLYLTILENNRAFDVWKNKLVSIPESEIKSINTINALKQKIQKYGTEEDE